MRTFYLLRNIKLTILLKVLVPKVNKVVINGNKWNCIATQSLLVNLLKKTFKKGYPPPILLVTCLI